LPGTDPQTWEKIAEFHKTEAVVTSLKVVNDTAERSVAQMRQHLDNFIMDFLPVHYIDRNAETYTGCGVQ